MPQQGCGEKVRSVEVNRIVDDKMQGVRSPNRGSENLYDIMKMVVGEIGEEFTPNKVSSSRSLFVVTVTCTDIGKVFKSVHLLCKDVKNERDSDIEHVCYECWTSEESNPTSEGILHVPRHEQVEVHKSLGRKSL